MDRQEVTLTLKEQKRLHVLNQIEAGEITVEMGAELLGITERHLYRLKASYRERGAQALAHGNRGRPSPRRLPEEIRLEVVKLVRDRYRNFNDHHLTEMLKEHHRIQISRSSVRRLRRDAGLPSPRKRRAPKHRSRRERYPRPGMLLQIDGSDHAWLGDRRPSLTLVAAIDDATGQVPAALFRLQEDAAGYFLLLRAIAESQGLPLAFYADRHSIFRSPKQASVEQQLAGESPRSQFGRLVDELGIELIPSYSPQGRGRIERLFGTFQDRLANELALAEISTLEEANQFLAEFLLRFNASFTQPPAEAESAYLPLPKELDLEALFCFKYSRKVRTDNTISFAGHVLQIPPDRHRGSYARCRVEVRQHMDGHLSAWYQERELVAFEPETAGPPRVGKFTPAVKAVVQEFPTNGKEKKARPPKKRKPWKPPADHPWRRPLKLSAKSKD
ncbi:MAG: ISNCY family transposase [Anaerolineales bacterium]